VSSEEEKNIHRIKEQRQMIREKRNRRRIVEKKFISFYRIQLRKKK